MQHNVSESTVKNANEFSLQKRATRTNIALQLFLTHGMTSTIALVIIFALPHLGVSSAMSTIAPIVLSGGLGLLLTANILYEVQQIERAVTDMNQGRSITFPTFSWPLTQLFSHLHTLDRRVQMYVQGEQAAVEIRRHYLQQASESATRTERQRIARDLHDSIKQQLFSISVSAATAKAYWSKDISKAQTAISDIQHVVKEAQVEMQALLQQLGSTPLENTRLADALQTQAEALKYRSGLEMTLTIGDLPDDELLPEGAQETIFRLVQEAFANIARHARAKAVTVTLQQTERALHLIISDNGKGFDATVARAGMGLTNMRERVAALNGTIEVQSALEQGTTLHIVIPFIPMQPSVADKPWSERELRQGLERAINGFQIVTTALYIALFFVTCNISNLFIQIPGGAIAICALIMGYGLWQGHSWKTRLLPYWGKENLDILKLQQREERIGLYLLFILFSGISHFLQIQNSWEGIYVTISYIAVFTLFIGLLLLLFWRRYHTQISIYRAMVPDDVNVEIRYQRRKMTRHVRVLLSVAVGILFVGARFLSSHLSTSIVQLSIIVIAQLVLVGCVILIFDFIVLRQQRRAVGGEQEKVTLVSLLRGE
jgi:signal transduction histidine kinase